MGPGLQPSTRTTRDESRSMRGSSDAIAAAGPRKLPAPLLSHHRRHRRATAEATTPPAPPPGAGRGAFRPVVRRTGCGAGRLPPSVRRLLPAHGHGFRLKEHGGFSLKTRPLRTNAAVIQWNKGGVVLRRIGASLLPSERQVLLCWLLPKAGRNLL